MKVRTEKNFLPSIFFDKLKDTITSNYFPWYFESQTVSSKYFEEDNHFMFYHVLWAINSGKYSKSSSYFETFEPIVYFLDGKIKLKKLLRMKLNLYTNQNKKIEHVSHVDIVDKNIPRENVTISLLNFITCNGGTIIKDKKYPSNENDLLIFDNLNKHSGIVQTDTQTRIVLNIDTE